MTTPDQAQLSPVPIRLFIKTDEAFFLEAKAPGGRVSPDQVAFKEMANIAGAYYYIVRSIDDVEALGL